MKNLGNLSFIILFLCSNYSTNCFLSGSLVTKSCRLATPQTVACQASLSMGFPKQEYWSGLPFSSPGDLSDPGIEPSSLHLLHRQVDSLSAEPLGKYRAQVLTDWTASFLLPKEPMVTFYNTLGELYKFVFWIYGLWIWGL